MRLRLLCGSGNAHRPPRRGADPSCDYNQVTLTAEASEGWVFDYWWGDVTPGVSSTLSPRVTEEYARIQNRNYNPTITLAIDKEKRVNAHFVYRPGISGLDLVADLGEFLVTIGVNTEASDVYNLDYDRGDFTVDGDANDVFTGNGIPDAAEFALLEAILMDVYLEPSARGGTDHEVVWSDWQQNLAQAQTDLPGLDASFQRVVAAYMTLGSYGYRDMICSAANTYWQQVSGTADSPVVASDYANMAFPELQASGDADNDGTSNLGEWSAAVASLDNSPLTGTALAEAEMEAFSGNALDSDKGAATTGEGESEGEGEDCVYDACTPQSAAITVNDDGFGLASVSASIDEPGKTPIISGQSVILGRGIAVKAELAQYLRSFTWYAPNTMIDGSNSTSEHFVHTATAEIAPTVGYSYITVKNTTWAGGTVSVSGDGVSKVTDPEEIEKHRIENGEDFDTWCTEYSVYKGPNNNIAELTLSFTPPASDPTLTGMGWCTGTSATLANTIKIRLGDPSIDSELKPRAGKGPLYGMWSITATSAGGGDVYAGAGGGSPFKNSVTTGAKAPEALYAFTCWSCGCVAYPGYQFAYWEHDGQKTKGVGGGILYHSEVATATFIKCPILQVDRKIEKGNESSACAGYVTVTPAQKYYSAPYSCTIDGKARQYGTERISLAAVATPGYRFVRWEGSGTVWTKNAVTNQFKKVSLDNHASPVTATDISLYLSDDAGEHAKSRALTAVYSEHVAWLCIKANCSLSGGHAAWLFVLRDCVQNDIPTSLGAYIGKVQGIGVKNGELDGALYGCMEFHDEDETNTYGYAYSRSWPLTFTELVSGLQTVAEIKEECDSPNNTEYNLTMNNCATVTVRVANACGVSLDSADAEQHTAAWCPCVLSTLLNPNNECREGKQ